jgi:hypothetical protein
VEAAIATQAGGIAQPGLPTVETLIRRTNRAREKLRPQHPKTLDEEVILSDNVAITWSLFVGCSVSFSAGYIFFVIAFFLITVYFSCMFQLCETFFPPEFFRKDIRGGLKRQLVFATEDQIQLLANAKTWYVN